MATLTSVNVGMPKDVQWNHRTVYTSAWKQPVTGPRMVRRLNVDGDGQGDFGGHGGENRAVQVKQRVDLGDRDLLGSGADLDDLLAGFDFTFGDHLAVEPRSPT